MISIVSSPVTIQTSAQSVPSPPGWTGEVALIAHYLRKQGVFSAIAEQVRCARRRFGRYEVLDFVAVLLGYAISGERTRGKLFGVPPTGKSVRFQNISIATVVDQQVVQYNSETGWLDFLMQVGALPLK